MTTQINLGDIAVDVVFGHQNIHSGVYPPTARSGLRHRRARAWMPSGFRHIEAGVDQTTTEETSGKFCSKFRRAKLDRESHYLWGHVTCSR